ncbi:hypothetical protein PsAD2_04522 [Pseudovibrio axinellae]|uniref:Sirohydrochlorin ferrochelatase n=1 Tax=Pseudovibrio axinellae TaxID=989403 RepID=A0A165T1H3_9HYPH|nr:hypothetical protein PsAD2_04522 [Pseudovibrio axinellae]SER50792.1 Sirohydrochlorin ferrochelatase [Pseudovibrio axinellae]
MSHGQPSNPDAGERYLSSLAQKVALHMPDMNVRAATLAAPGKLEQAIACAEGLPLVFPLFMADGWFVRKALPNRLGALKPRILPPLGILPELPALVAELLKERILQQGWELENTRLLIAAHGSATGPVPAECTRAFAGLLLQHIALGDTRIGFLEQRPFLHETASDMDRQTILLPLFAGDGGHVESDLPLALKHAGFHGLRLPALGQLNFVPELIATQLQKASSCKVAA